MGPNGSGKTTFIKLANNLLTPTCGEIRIAGMKPGVETKRIVSYLPEKTYLNDWMRVQQIIELFSDFYDNFKPEKAYEMLKRLNINADDRLKTSLGAFIALNAASQIMMAIIGSIGSQLHLPEISFGQDQIFTASPIFHLIFWCVIIYFGLISAGYFILTNYILSKRLNLE